MLNFIRYTNKHLLQMAFLSGAGVFGLCFATAFLFQGCAECQYDSDCPSSALCQGGRCIVQQKNPEGGAERRRPPPPCLEGETRACYSGPEKTREQGICKDGQQICSGGQWGICSGQILPQQESCDGKDNDCDGTIDDGCSCTDGEKQSCFSGKTENRGQGICKDGQQLCVKGKWTACLGQQFPQPESCNGLDDNCDGVIDDGNPGGKQSCLVPGVMGPCSQGETRCQQGKIICVQTLQPTKEECANGKDDDCDGKIDESPPCQCTAGQTQPCYNGPGDTRNKGLCREGQQTCRTDQTWGKCLGQVLPQKETCDGQDNDCNGKIDNLSRPCRQGCNHGQEICQHGKWGPCDARPADPEVCDGKDNDCNGKTDDVVGYRCECLLSQTQSCGSSTGECKKGIRRCIQGRWSKICEGEVQGRPEICDSKDNDCDGKVDDNLSCSKGGVYQNKGSSEKFYCTGSQLQYIQSALAFACRFPGVIVKNWPSSCINGVPRGKSLDHSSCLRKIYRYSYCQSGNCHFYYTTFSTWSRSGYSKNGVAFQVLTSSFSGGRECKAYTKWSDRDTYIYCGGPGSGENNLLSLGFTDVKTLGWMASKTSTTHSTVLGVTFRPLWRSYSSTLRTHLFTASKAEHDNAVNNLGYKNENVAAHVP